MAERSWSQALRTPPSVGDGALVEVRHLMKYFSGGGRLGRRRPVVKAVDGVSFTVARGETLALVGESGSGKSTTAEVILHLQEPTAGDVLFEGRPVFRLVGEDLRALRREMQIVFQNPFSSLNPRMRVRDILAEPLRTHGLTDGDHEERVDELLRLVQLDARHKDRFPHEFSGGQRQRICLARALAVRPRFLVLDEPLSALDVSVQAQMINLLRRLQRELGLTYLFISHDLRVVRQISDRVAVMYLGKIVEIGTVEEIFSLPLHPYTAALLSAVPVPDPRALRRRILLQGEIPSPMAIPSGCRFHTRCFAAVDQCRSAEPPLISVTPTHAVACHLVHGSERLWQIPASTPFDGRDHR